MFRQTIKWNPEPEPDVDQLISQYDKTFMPLPDIEFEPHLLISKVRKHYMEYMIRLLAANYETNHKLVNKNVYLPSAIWRCAKNLEMKAAQSCMVVQLYRKYIVSLINEVKKDTSRGRLNEKLYECLHKEPPNEKRTQTSATSDCTCQCYGSDKKRRKKRPSSAKIMQSLDQSATLEENNTDDYAHKIPVITSMQTDYQPVNQTPDLLTNMQPDFNLVNQINHNNVKQITPNILNHTTSNIVNQMTPNMVNLIPPNILNQPAMTPKSNEHSDELMLQLEKLFQSDHNEDDLFEGALFETTDSAYDEMSKNLQNSTIANEEHLGIIKTQDSIIENHAAQIRSLDERLATLTGMLNSEPQNVPPLPQKAQEIVQKKQKHVSKWICEEHFLKKNLFEMLYEIGDNNRKKLARIKEMYIQLFGEDSDDEEGIVSPDESPEFVASCKSRIDSWVTAILAPYYAKGKIKGKLLYKGVARHLIELIYKCKQYPSRFEVTSFVLDFLENRDKIRCEADYKEFKIDNIHQVPNYSFL